MIGAEVEYEKNNFRPAANQQVLCARVADVIECCCDEWLSGTPEVTAAGTTENDWQEGPLTAKFWGFVADRLLVLRKYWGEYHPSAIEVYKIAMAYTARFDPNGRGATEEESEWGFELSQLTWGNRRAELDPDVFAKRWVCDIEYSLLNFQTSRHAKENFTYQFQKNYERV